MRDNNSASPLKQLIASAMRVDTNFLHAFHPEMAKLIHDNTSLNSHSQQVTPFLRWRRRSQQIESSTQ